MIERYIIFSVLCFLLWVTVAKAQTIAANARAEVSEERHGPVSILQASSGSSPTPVPGIYGDETYGQINLVADLGGDPTGKTDSTAAVQGFISAIKNGFGGVVPPGTYSVSSTINIQGRNSIRLAGLGGGIMGATIFRWDGASGGTVFALNGVADSYFQHFSIRGGAGSVGVCFNVTDGTSDRFVDLGCEGSSVAAFQFSNTSGTAGFDRIEHFDVNCSGGDGIQILSSSSIGNDFVDGSIANCADGINGTSGAFLSEELSFSNNKIDVHLGPQNGSTGLYTPQSAGAGQFLAVDAADGLPIKIEGAQITVSAGQSGNIINDAGSGPLALSNNWFISTSSPDNLLILVGSASGSGSAVSVGNVYPAGFPLAGQASISSLGDVSSTLGTLPVELGATTVQTPAATPTATTIRPPVTPTATPTASSTATIAFTPSTTSTATPTDTATETVTPTATPTRTTTATASTTRTPTATSTGTATVTVTQTATATATATSTATASKTSTPTATPTLPSPLSVRPTSLRFDNTDVNKQSSFRTLHARNAGTATVSLNNMQITREFRRAGGTCRSVLGKHEQCTYRLVFSPTAAGATLGRFSVGDLGSGERQTVSLSGMGK